MAKVLRSYTPYYIGRVVNGSIENYRWLVNTGGGGPTAGVYNPLEYGQEDFQEKFLDFYFDRNVPAFNGDYLNMNIPIHKTNNDKNVPQSGRSKGQWSDQVHHFVFGFSAGMNGAFWGATYQNLFRDGPENNFGDVRLTNAAYDIGMGLRYATVGAKKVTLNNIGETIKTRICQK